LFASQLRVLLSQVQNDSAGTLGYALERGVNMVRSRWCLLLVAAWCLACQPGEKSTVTPPQGSGIASAAAAMPEDCDIEITNGQSIYVPVYSHVYYFVGKKQYPIATTLSIRNTEPKHPIPLRDVD
jgi:hypothetical protein